MRFRLLDTGPSTAARNMALDQVLLEGCAAGTSPPTLRFLRFDPPAVLVGAYQRIEDEVRQDHCRAHGIHVNRRITGGGTIFFDRSQLGFEVVCLKEHLGVTGPSTSLFELLCEPVIRALRTLGLDASFRPRNDVEIHGRKISGTGGTSHKDALLFQGTLLTDFDADSMVRALRVPVEKLRRHEMQTLTARVTWISRELGVCPPHEALVDLVARHFASTLHVDLAPGDLSDDERRALDAALPRFESDEWITGRGRRPTEHVRALTPTPGGMLRPLISTDPQRSRIQALVLDGDFFAYPDRAILDLEAALKGAHVRQVPSIVREHLGGRAVIQDVTAEHVISSIGEALDRTRAPGLTAAQANSTFPVCCRLADIPDLHPTHLLLPYCAKPLDCEHRNDPTCDTCGTCAIGDSHELARARGLEVVSITSFEHLMTTLADLSRRGIRAWLGSCCEPFYVKHRVELEAFGLPGILFDVASDETCYDLGKGSLAYAGRFEGLSEMDLDLLRAILDACKPPVEKAEP